MSKNKKNKKKSKDKKKLLNSKEQVSKVEAILDNSNMDQIKLLCERLHKVESQLNSLTEEIISLAKDTEEKLDNSIQ